MDYSFQKAISFHQFAIDNCVADTGFLSSSLEHLWSKYNSWNGSAPGSFGDTTLPYTPLVQRQYHFYCVYVLIHKCPQNNWMSQFRSRNGLYSLSTSSFKKFVYPLAKAYAQIMEEVDRSRRLSPFNHGPFPFHQLCTGIVDTFPVKVPHPHRFALARLLYQPKYKATVLKWQLGITFTGEIILFTGPHLGTIHDSTIWESTWADHPFFSWELWLADLGYQGCDGLMVKYKGDQIRGEREQWFNNVHEDVRNRVEQIVAVIKKHKLFSGGYRRGFYLLEAWWKL